MKNEEDANQCFAKNDNLAFNLMTDAMNQYANKCEFDEDKGMMDPLQGTYFLINNLATALFYKSEGHMDLCEDIILEAVEDAFETVENTRQKTKKLEVVK
ncbi:MAG: hypothetical protein CMC89_02830 [Flavobacteriaceae bacterium]|nr:hypothetical protein [Flavobacteriaceae bacterium]|tara:strand:+ start:5607 stop:5906 length:300 start_codon:yes stop_codon:yes gene_type:complete